VMLSRFIVISRPGRRWHFGQRCTESEMIDEGGGKGRVIAASTNESPLWLS